MRFTLRLAPISSGPHEDVLLTQRVIRQARRATYGGFAGVSLTEHHGTGLSTYGDNIMLAAHLAPLTAPGTTFMLAIVVPHLHNPTRLAQRLNLLDHLCDGNLVIGLGSGQSDPIETGSVGRRLEREHRYEDMLTSVEILDRIDARPPAAPALGWHTHYERGTLHGRIKPYRHRRRPYARATVSDETTEWTARRGWYLFTGKGSLDATVAQFGLYRRGLEDAGFDSETIEDRLDWSICQKIVAVTETDEQALAIVDKQIELIEEAAQMHAGRGGGGRGAGPTLQALRDDRKKFIEDRFIAGSAETVRRTLEAYDAAGVRHLDITFFHRAGALPFMPRRGSDSESEEEADAMLERFIESVLPHFSTSQ